MHSIRTSAESIRKNGFCLAIPENMILHFSNDNYILVEVTVKKRSLSRNSEMNSRIDPSADDRLSNPFLSGTGSNGLDENHNPTVVSSVAFRESMSYVNTSIRSSIHAPSIMNSRTRAGYESGHPTDQTTASAPPSYYHSTMQEGPND